jgi:hypothetical protein
MMVAFNVEPVLSAAIAGGLALLGVMVTVRGGSRRGTSQHLEQTELLNKIMSSAAEHKQTTERGLSDMNIRVDGLYENQNILFNMISEVDLKVTKPATVRGRAKVSVETNELERVMYR